MSKPKRHHYLSQFYLAGFTSNGKKNGDLYCFELKTKRVRKSKVKEEGHEKYFNKIDLENYDENYLEMELSRFESEAASIFNKITTNKCLPSTSEDWGILFYFISLMGIRNPDIRETIDSAKTNLLKVMLQFALASSKTWENFKENQLNDLDLPEIKNLSYMEACKKLYDLNFNLKSQPTEHIKTELPMVKRVAELLSHREWSLIDASKSKYDFITSDRPVKLFWNNKELNSLNWGPGFGMKDSELFFPFTKKFYLWGTFNKNIPLITANDEMVATINSLQFYYSKRFLYGPQSDFYFDSN